MLHNPAGICWHMTFFIFKICHNWDVGEMKGFESSKARDLFNGKKVIWKSANEQVNMKSFKSILLVLFLVEGYNTLLFSVKWIP